jgi:hypothetical protein
MFVSSPKPRFVQERFGSRLNMRPRLGRSASAVPLPERTPTWRPGLNHRASLPAAEALAQSRAEHAEFAPSEEEDDGVDAVCIDSLQRDVQVSRWQLQLGDLHKVVAGSTQALAAFQTAQERRQQALHDAAQQQALAQTQALAAAQAQQQAAQAARAYQQRIAMRPGLLRARARRQNTFWFKVGQVITWPWRMLVSVVQRLAHALGVSDFRPA